MSTFRRVVTGHDGRGRSVIASDQKVAGVAVPGMPGVELTTLWGSDHTMRYPDDGSMPRSATWFAPVGGFRLIEFIIGPENPQIAVDHDPAGEPRRGRWELAGAAAIASGLWAKRFEATAAIGVVPALERRHRVAARRVGVGGPKAPGGDLAERRAKLAPRELAAGERADDFRTENCHRLGMVLRRQSFHEGISPFASPTPTCAGASRAPDRITICAGAILFGGDRSR
jgi:hypothetical protein